jgi:hypothetical protein
VVVRDDVEVQGASKPLRTVLAMAVRDFVDWWSGAGDAVR